MTNQPAVPAPTPADLGRDAAADYYRMVDPYCSLHPQEIRGYARLWITLGVHYRAALDAERRRADEAEEQRDAMIGMDEAGVDTLLERWDQTAPHVQRGIVAKFMAMLHENAEEAKGWRKAIEEMSDAGASACQAAAKLTEERDALRQEVAGLRAGLGRMTPLAERAALVIAHHALNSRECSSVCRRCEAEKVLAQARQLLDRPS